jgi:hypothetical protein
MYIVGGSEQWTVQVRYYAVYIHIVLVHVYKLCTVEVSCMYLNLKTAGGGLDHRGKYGD